MTMFAFISLLVFQTLLCPLLISAESYLTARLNPAPFQNFAIQEVHLYPGWQFELKEMTIQTMVPKVGSNFSRCQVRVFPGRQPVEGPEDMHAHVYFPTAVEEVTMYIEHDAPEVTELSTTPEARVTEASTTPEVSIEHGYVLARLTAERWHTFVDGEIVHLSPPWFDEGRDHMNASMEPEIATHFSLRKVTIMLGWRDVTEEDGGIRAIATVHSRRFPGHSTETKITLYPDYHLSKTSSSTTVTTPIANSDSTTTAMPQDYMYLDARIFPKYWHPFRDDQFVKLYPGWKGHLQFNTTQTLIPVDLGQKSVLKQHVVIVAPGYRTIPKGDLAAEARVTLPDGEGLADPHDEVTIYYP